MIRSTDRDVLIRRHQLVAALRAPLEEYERAADDVPTLPTDKRIRELRAGIPDLPALDAPHEHRPASSHPEHTTPRRVLDVTLERAAALHVSGRIASGAWAPQCSILSAHVKGSRYTHGVLMRADRRREGQDGNAATSASVRAAEGR